MPDILPRNADSTIRESPKIAQKRRAILKHAMRVFAKEGFRNTDVQVIADLAGVGKGTVYRHFGNKEQLFLATARSCLDELGEYVSKKVGVGDELPSAIGARGAAGLLRDIALACAEYYERNPQAVELMIQERAEFREAVFPSHLMYRAENRGEFDQLVQLAIDTGEFRQVNVAQASNAFGDLIYGSIVNGCLEGGRGQLVSRVTSAVDIFLDGLVAQPVQSEAASRKQRKQ